MSAAWTVDDQLWVARYGREMRVARERAGVTQADLGKELRVSQGLVGEWESGAAVPNVLQAHKAFLYLAHRAKPRRAALIEDLSQGKLRRRTRNPRVERVA